MSVNVTYASTVTAVETLETNVPAAGAGNCVVTHNLFNTQAALTKDTTPPVTKVAMLLQALSSGIATIDLRNLVGTNGGVVDGNGLKVQLFKMKNLGANEMSITFGANAPYNLLGADFKMTLAPGMEQTIYGNDATPDIAAGAKEMDLAGTGEQTAEITIVMG